jgi:DNA-binding transcriptional MerR regulator
MSDDARYGLTELADLAGVTPRTVRYYLASGLLPGVGQPGPGAKYGDEHLDRLRVIRRLQREHLPLAEIRRRLVDLDEATIHGLAHPDPVPEPRDTALEYVRDLLGASSVMPSRPPAAPLPMRAAYSIAETLGDEPGPTPMTVERSQWERIVLAPDVELHVRRPSRRAQNKRIERLVTIARELLEEDRA